LSVAWFWMAVLLALPGCDRLFGLVTVPDAPPAGPGAIELCHLLRHRIEK
jgi:hypothetical protein